MMSLRFSLDHCFKVTIIAGTVLLSSKIIADEGLPKRPIGIIEGIEKLIEIADKNFTSTLNESSKRSFDPSELKGNQIFLHEDFITSIMFHSDPSYLALADAGECSFLDAMSANLFQIKGEELKNLLIQVKKAGSSALTSGMVPVYEYVKIAKSEICGSKGDLKDSFTPSKIRSKLAEYSIKIPTNQASCSENFNFWKNSSDTPFICGLIKEVSGITSLKERSKLAKTPLKEKEYLANRIDRAEKLRSEVGEEYYTYFKHLCSNLDNVTNYCTKYAKTSFWNKLLLSNDSSQTLAAKCSEIIKKDGTLKRDELEKCVEMINSDETKCMYAGSTKYPALTPMPSCDESGLALNNSRLSRNLKDCPGRLDNDGIINISRLITHFDSSKLESDDTVCASRPQAKFLDMLAKSSNESKWLNSICYDNKASGKEECFPAISFDDPTSDYSEGSVVKKILMKTRPVDATMKCKALSSKTFRPELLEYKVGCFIVYNENFCTAMNCKREIYLNESKITHIRYREGSPFDYFPLSYKDERYAATSIFSEIFKRKSSRIENFTHLKYFINEHKNAVVHGIGCREDIYPRFFKKYSFNQCTPVPFIIDGIVSDLTDQTDQTEMSVVLRTTYDNIDAPRVVRWTNVFSAVKNYQQINPINSWMMYVVY